MSRKCLYCYQKLKGDSDFHEKCSLDFFGSKVPPLLDYSMNQMTELAKSVVERSVAIPGVQPKLSLSVIDESLKNDYRGRLTVVGALGGNYIFKPPSQQFSEMPQNEHATMLMAKQAFGIKTVPSSLIRLASGELGYITRRIDRTSNGTKIHMLDMFQILEAFDKYKGSMERIGKAISAYSANTLLDQLFYFEVVLFSYITGNSDMHLKNFSMIAKNDDWELAPAYDLLSVKIVLPEDEDELALPIEAKKRKLKLEHFGHFAKGLGLSDRQIQNAFSRFKKDHTKAFDLLDESFLSQEMRIAYKSLITERLDNLFGSR
jgi:serine/threonine-protein kinase HipA